LAEDNVMSFTKSGRKHFRNLRFIGNYSKNNEIFYFDIPKVVIEVLKIVPIGYTTSVITADRQIVVGVRCAMIGIFLKDLLISVFVSAQESRGTHG